MAQGQDDVLDFSTDQSQSENSNLKVDETYDPRP